MEGGGSGGFGRNTWIKRCRKEDGDLPEYVDEESVSLDQRQSQSYTRKINVGGKSTVMMGKGDHFVIETPGGGAWGIPDGIEDPGESWKYEGGARGSWKDREARQAEF
jgi:5-oxoprolinase (ATP-hydrolysing)